MKKNFLTTITAASSAVGYAARRRARK